MNHYLIDGNQQAFPENPNASFNEFIGELKKELIKSKTIISMIKINGVELSQVDEVALRDKPVSKIGSIEIKTIGHKALTHEILEMLGSFTENIEFMAKRAAALLSEGSNANMEFERVIEGIEILIQGLERPAFTKNREMELLKADLLSISNDLQESYKKKEIQYVIDLLNQHLVQNLSEWRSKGIPAIKRRSN